MSHDPYFTRLRAAQAEPAALAAMQDPELVKRMAAQLAPDPGYVPPAVKTADDAAPGPHGPVPVRVYLPSEAASKPRPLFVWLHGGGWNEGDLDMHEADATSREVCARAGAVVVSVDYRLATEGVFYPVPLDDVLAAWQWAVESAPQWGAARHRAVLGGASAGGNLAAGAALRLRDEGGPAPSRLALVYPVLHAQLPPLTDEQRTQTGMTQQYEELFGKGLVLAVENYVGAPVEQAPAYVVPALADAAGLPPTLVVTCEWDALRSSGETYAEHLRMAGVPNRLVVVPAINHAHLNSPWLAQAQETFRDLAEWAVEATTA